MKKVISELSLNNWNKEAGKVMMLLAGSIGILAVWSDEFLRLLHEAPFPVSEAVDAWVKWLLKIGSSILALITLLSKKKNDIDIGVKVTDATTPAETSMGKREI